MGECLVRRNREIEFRRKLVRDRRRNLLGGTGPEITVRCIYKRGYPSFASGRNRGFEAVIVVGPWLQYDSRGNLKGLEKAFVSAIVVEEGMNRVA